MRAIIRAEVFKAKNGQFYAHLIGGNNRKLWTSGETMHNEADAHKAVRATFVGIASLYAPDLHRSEIAVPYSVQSLKPSRTPYTVP